MTFRGHPGITPATRPREVAHVSGPTMSAVARAAGVSVSTVSHFVNGTRQISAERDRVRAAMERLGYVHHPVARSLGAGTGRTVGLAVTVTSNLSLPAPPAPAS